jgi:hypothetical protein
MSTTETKDETQQQPLLGMPKHEVGDTVVIGEHGGTVIQVSDDGKKIKVKYQLIDGDSERWHDITEIDGETVEQPTPEVDQVAELQEAVKRLTAEAKKAVESLEQQQKLTMIAERQRDKAKEDCAETEEKLKTHRPLEPGELTVLKAEVARLTAENIKLKERPPVEVKTIIRPVNVTTGVHDDADIAKWFAGGWQIVPELTLSKLWKPGKNEVSQPWERITFRRDSKKTMQPHHGLEEIEKAFDKQADREHPLLDSNSRQL